MVEMVVRRHFDRRTRLGQQDLRRSYRWPQPQHLPRQVFGLVNSYVLHKITDAQVISTLRHTVSGIDDGLWSRLPGLTPGQAIVSFPHMTRPLLVSIDPAPAELRLVD
jgi:DNA helicase HerA-like ATPase